MHFPEILGISKDLQTFFVSNKDLQAKSLLPKSYDHRPYQYSNFSENSKSWTQIRFFTNFLKTEHFDFYQFLTSISIFFILHI